MRESWRRRPAKGNKLTSWAEAYRTDKNQDGTFSVRCLYENVSAGEGDTLAEAKADFCENIRLQIGELAEMLEFCSRNDPK